MSKESLVEEERKRGIPAVEMKTRASGRSYLRRRTGEAKRVRMDGGFMKNKKEVFERYPIQILIQKSLGDKE